MATSKLCSMCNKEPGRMYCTGCDKYFCKKDFKTHQDEMVTEMEKIVEERNRLQDAINNSQSNNDQQSPLIEQIERWKNSTIKKVERVAAQAHQQAIEILNAKRTKIITDFKSFSQELIHLKESENYVEHDLEQLNQMIKKFKEDLKQSTQPTTIEIHTEESDKINWDSLIYVEEKQTFLKSRPRQQTASKFNNY